MGAGAEPPEPPHFNHWLLLREGRGEEGMEGGARREGNGWEGEEGRERGPPSVPPAPNLPLERPLVVVVD